MSRHPAKPSLFWFLWAWPLLLGVLTAVGLVAALFSDGGFGDLLAGVCLSLPVIVGAWYGWGRRSPASDD